MLKTNKSAIICNFYKINSEESQDWGREQLQQSECSNIFPQNALNRSFQTFREQYLVNDTRKYSNSDNFLMFLSSFFSWQDFFFNCDSLHARLNSHFEKSSYKKKKHKKIKANKKSV